MFGMVVFVGLLLFCIGGLLLHPTVIGVFVAVPVLALVLFFTVVVAPLMALLERVASARSARHLKTY